LSSHYQIREFKENDLENTVNFILDMLINEFKIALDFDNLDSDLFNIKNHYNKENGGCFWIVECKDDSQIIGTVAIRRIKDTSSDETNKLNPVDICELKRMFLSKRFRGQGIGQQMLDTAFQYAKKAGYSKIFLYSSKDLKVSRHLYLKNGFMDILRYNNDHRADVFMEKIL
jgi:RimJ/RimL family protein N-acetyltransferase